MSHETLSPVNSSYVPGYGSLNNFDWCEDFLACERIKRELHELGENKKQLREIPSTKKAFEKRLKDSFEKYQERRKNWLIRYLKTVERSDDPFKRFERAIRIDYFKFLSWGEVEEALSEMTFGEGISDSKRDEQMSQINTRIAKLESELKALSPQIFFPFVDGSCVGDIRVSFVRHWLSIQDRCCEPCNPCGIALEQSPDLEKQAYETLRIAKAINFDTRLRPYVAR